MKVELNFNLNEKSPNGRIYDKQQMIEQLESKISENKLFVYSCDPFDLSNMVGRVTSYEEKDGKVFVDIDMINKLVESQITQNTKITTAGIGEIIDSLVKNFELTSLYLVNE